MNAMDFDLVTFGNHEFDLKEKDLQKRLNESTFNWMSSNSRHIENNTNLPFTIQKENDTTNVSDTYIFNVNDKNGNQLKIGFLGVTIPSNPKDYVFYGDMYKESKRAYEELKDEVAIVFGLTHLEIEQDTELLTQIPEIL